MDLDPLDKPFDVVVCGTDTACSVFAAAAARNGLSVLHIEDSDVYGGVDGTVPLQQFVRATSATNVQDAMPDLSSLKRKVPSEWSVSSCLAPATSESSHLIRVHTDDAPVDLAAVLRKVLIDIWPRLVFCRGASTDLLVESGVSSYMEYKNLDCAALLSLLPSDTGTAIHATPVPAGKGDVFSAPSLSLADKRRLMKFLQFVLDVGPEQSSSGTVLGLNESQLGHGRSLLRPQNKGLPAYDLQQYTEKPLSALMTDAEIEGPLQSMLLHAVGLIDCPPGHPQEPHAAAGVARLYAHMGALGRFGKTAYLANMYGTGETSQAFCRACAVHGGVYMLRTRITGWHLGVSSGGVGKEGVVGVRVREEGQGETTVYGRRFIVGDRQRHVLPPSWLPSSSPSPSSSLAVCVALVQEGSVGRIPGLQEQPQLWHGILPAWTAPLHFSHAVHVLHTGSSTHTCPGGYSLLYCMTRVMDTDTERGHEGVGRSMMDTLLPLLVPAGGVLWRGVYCIPFTRSTDAAPPPSAPTNLHILSTSPYCGESEENSYITIDGPLQAAARAWRDVMVGQDGTVPAMFPPVPVAPVSTGEEQGTGGAQQQGAQEEKAVEEAGPAASSTPVTWSGSDTMDVHAALHLLSQGSLLDDL